MKQRAKASVSTLNAYDEGFRKGILIALQEEKLNLKKLNPYHLIFNLACWQAFINAAKDGFMQGIRQRENHRAYIRLKELEKIKHQSKEKFQDSEQER